MQVTLAEGLALALEARIDNALCRLFVEMHDVIADPLDLIIEAHVVGAEGFKAGRFCSLGSEIGKLRYEKH